MAIEVRGLAPVVVLVDGDWCGRECRFLMDSGYECALFGVQLQRRDERCGMCRIWFREVNNVWAE